MVLVSLRPLRPLLSVTLSHSSEFERGDSPDSPGRYFSSSGSSSGSSFSSRDRYLAIFPVYDREWFTPVALTAEKPVAKLIVYLCTSEIFRNKPCDNFRNSCFFIKSVDIYSGCFIRRIYIISVLSPALPSFNNSLTLFRIRDIGILDT